MSGSVWRQREADHHELVDRLTKEHRRRTADRHTHPVEDFLFTYYSLRPAQLRRWNPGPGIVLLDAPERAGWRYHRQWPGPGRDAGSGRAGGFRAAGVLVDVAAFRESRGTTVEFVHRLLTASAVAPGHFGCFGLHEWAMLYRAEPDDRRHLAWPLRLGQAGTDQVVTGHQIRCSHFDAFRFFTPAARPLNLLQPDQAGREAMEQPGCLHATMDLYKWAYKLGPLVPSELLVDCFRLARRIREVDMRASPYDLRALGYQPIEIETAAGKAEYVAAQRQFAADGQGLRSRLLTAIEAADTADRMGG